MTFLREQTGSTMYFVGVSFISRDSVSRNKRGQDLLFASKLILQLNQNNESI